MEKKKEFVDQNQEEEQKITTSTDDQQNQDQQAQQQSNMNVPSELAEQFNNLKINQQLQQYLQQNPHIQQQISVPGQFWKTQPVPQLQDITSIPNSEWQQGPIDEQKTVDQVRKDPYNLPDGFEWTDLNLKEDAQVGDVYQLLTENYVEDDDSMFRFDYSREFLKWALNPPGYFQEWIIGVRVKKSQKLVGFITAIPLHVLVENAKVKMAEVNFLCVHKKMRKHRLAPVLIKEITRRVNLKNIWQAVYTAGVVVPTPVSKAQYYHRNLNPIKLIETQFSVLGPNQTKARLVKLYKLPEQTKIPGIRPMQKKDISSVYKLLTKELESIKLHCKFSEEEVKHYFIPRNDIIYSYVVENEDKQITDFTSFYSLPSSILKNPKYNQLRAAYSYYNVATTVTLKDLVYDSLILAQQEGFDVYNALNIMKNQQFLQELMFSPGDGNLHYYLYNWKVSSKVLQSEDLGIVLV